MCVRKDDRARHAAAEPTTVPVALYGAPPEMLDAQSMAQAYGAPPIMASDAAAPDAGVKPKKK